MTKIASIPLLNVWTYLHAWKISEQRWRSREQKKSNKTTMGSEQNLVNFDTQQQIHYKRTNGWLTGCRTSEPDVDQSAFFRVIASSWQLDRKKICGCGRTWASLWRLELVAEKEQGSQFVDIIVLCHLARKRHCGSRYDVNLLWVSLDSGCALVV